MNLRDFHLSVMEKPMPYVVFRNSLNERGEKTGSVFFDTCDENRVFFYTCNNCNYGVYSVYKDTRIDAKVRLYMYLLKRFNVEHIKSYSPFCGTSIGITKPIR